MMAEEGEPLSKSVDEELFAQVFNEERDRELGVVQSVRKTSFAPWHHPVKQIVRDYQWAELSRRLLERERPADGRGVLRYFTLPGADLLDVRVLAEALQPIGAKIEYFGFNVGYKPPQDSADPEENGVYFATESLLRQSGRITNEAVILHDRLEDIAQAGSQAANRLGQRSVFDVINIDACDHLSFVPEGRAKSVFDALESLLAHQLRAVDPWLLFVTTRVNPSLLGPPGLKLQTAVNENLAHHQQEFGTALATCIGAQMQTLAGDLAKTWSTHNTSFLKLFSVSLGKYLLQFFHGQHNLSADVELASAFAYKVHQPEPDMLSLAFRVKPHGIRVQPATAGPASLTGLLEVKKAIRVVEKASGLWNIDEAIVSDVSVRKDAVEGAARLLESANYDLASWRAWLASLALRPMHLDEIPG